jgi:hypothetical protein
MRIHDQKVAIEEAKPKWHHFGGRSVGSDQREIRLKSRAHDLKNQDASYDQTQGFNLLQMSPN